MTYLYTCIDVMMSASNFRLLIARQIVGLCFVQPFSWCNQSIKERRSIYYSQNTREIKEVSIQFYNHIFITVLYRPMVIYTGVNAFLIAIQGV